MSKRVLVATSVAALLAPMAATSATAATTTAASNDDVARDTPGCVTKAEFRRIRKGMRKRRVHRIFDTRGTGTRYSRTYRACHRPKYSYVGIVFRSPAGTRVYSKHGYFAS